MADDSSLSEKRIQLQRSSSAGCKQSAYKAPLFKHTHMTFERVDKFISELYYQDVNLQSRLIKATLEPSDIFHCKVMSRFDFDAIRNSNKFTKAKIGDSFGPLWSTHWFRVQFDLPTSWVGEEVVFIWNSNSEATIWDEKLQQPVGAFSGGGHSIRDVHVFSKKLSEAGRVDFLLEMACNGVCGDGEGGFIFPPNTEMNFQLSKCHMAVRDSAVKGLILDLRILTDIHKSMEKDERGMVALHTANAMVNMLLSNESDCVLKCKELSCWYFSQGNGALQHTLYAVGHCHMDCAWLWPYEETKRKCGRSWATTLALMEKYPDMKFACSTAQQYAWVQEHYPKLFERIKSQVQAGRFLPVGGSWVEMDGNLPSGEAMCRQLLYGQTFFKNHFNLFCTEFWLPDTFGYSPQLPQIISLFGMRRFLTQKISWNLFNTFPHHTFKWEGLDGTQALAHFAPGNSYHMSVNVSEMVKTVENFLDKGRSRSSMFLYGHGDGGQGPTEDMMENIERLKNVDGLPRIKQATPDEFFSYIEQTDADNLCTWVGELYLEMHNGTYTTQGLIKRYNRKVEVLLHNIEAISAILCSTNTIEYPYEQLFSLWKDVLLNQFHDILPGSSIELVNNDAVDLYVQVEKKGNELLQSQLAHFSETQLNVGQDLVFNTLGWRRREVITLIHDAVETAQTGLEGKPYCIVDVPSYGFTTVDPKIEFSSCFINKQDDGSIVMTNNKLHVVLNSSGNVVELRLCNEQGISRRNAVSGPANQFVIYDDMPLFWDAWDVMDYHQETRKPVSSVISECAIKEEGPYRVSTETRFQISGDSYITQCVSLDAESGFVKFDCEVTWKENRKFFKVEFPLDIRSNHVTYETQFGHIERPSHKNTSWDSAKFEVCCQKWFDYSEHNFGVAILNDCKYGCSVDHSTVYLSLLRSPKWPDANADMGVHKFTYAMMPHEGRFQEAGVIQSAHALNTPLLQLSGATAKEKSYFSVNTASVILDTVKRPEERGVDGFVLRAYEAFGGTSFASFTVNVPFDSVISVDGLERKDNSTVAVDPVKRCFAATFKPFQIRTFLVRSSD